MTAHDRVNTALLLAAGTGSRLQPLTKNAPKCLTEVGGRPILERLVNNLRELKIDRLVVVIGHLGDHIRKFLDDTAGDFQVEYIISPRYRTTNNIYSLWLAHAHIHEPFLLLESDLVFDTALLENMLYPDKIAISRIRPWMNGTTVAVGPGKRVTAFHVGSGEENDASRYKTVNVYSLSAPTWNRVAARLDRYISDGRVGEYYEAVFAEMVADGTLSFEAAFLDPDRWYEVDTLNDLAEANLLFPVIKKASPALPTIPTAPFQC
jgi:NDP-sugar pyrophosphorylase family protein